MVQTTTVLFLSVLATSALAIPEPLSSWTGPASTALQEAEKQGRLALQQLQSASERVQGIQDSRKAGYRQALSLIRRNADDEYEFAARGEDTELEARFMWDMNKALGRSLDGDHSRLEARYKDAKYYLDTQTYPVSEPRALDDDWAIERRAALASNDGTPKVITGVFCREFDPEGLTARCVSDQPSSQEVTLKRTKTLLGKGNNAARWNKKRLGFQQKYKPEAEEASTVRRREYAGIEELD